MPFAMEGCVTRHDPASAGTVLKALKMYGDGHAVGDLIEQGAPAFRCVRRPPSAVQR
jgi:hypothetical protein